ncbi:hypothetical protein TVAG_376470 [Trichomonas vaginalis G3]|uniref:DUF3447 domain-containing protein n=1 Tax=Trichomonas vaginalis (strain ATCC PRA-98 / G3) TaxID=412133 RepID=A2FU75_TRIV3|nr:spectrin binding [Trichomonas vaginalis G3]EAX91536.1 hypothetical protein TVAG_376470 [Trichomonas vaginalis G3]KAI5509561.1 spectrin binding [Trichomonas vaginalis G3]|eukprot:XP_001304466.1 hypothetical protein [Trichomonas vaginalis G3]
MSKDGSKQYDDFIDAYDKIFHVKSVETIKDTYNLITDVLINKYKMSTYDILVSIVKAVRYNYRSFLIYCAILHDFLIKNPITDKEANKLTAMASYNFLSFTKDDDDVYQLEVRYSLDSIYPLDDTVESFIMDDQIDRFKEYVSNNSLDRIRVLISDDEQLTPIEACAYFGSVNIFTFLTTNLHHKISPRCLQYSLIGGNTELLMNA